MAIKKRAKSWVGQLRRLYVGFAVGVIFVTLAVSWQEVATLYKVIYVILFLGLLAAATAWPKQKTYNGDNNSDNNPHNTLEAEPGHKSSNNAAKS